MGDQLRLHVDLRLRLGPRRLGPVRLQHGVRAAMVSVLGHAKSRRHRPLFTTGQATIPAAASRHAAARLSDGDADLLPVRVRRHHRHHPGRLGARPHELHRLDDLLPGVDDPGLYGRGVQPLGRRLARRPRASRTSRAAMSSISPPEPRASSPPGWSGPRLQADRDHFPPNSLLDHAGRRRHPVARLERLQRRRPLLRQRRRRRGGAQHQHRDRGRRCWSGR